jgi:hypothetical protein
MKRLAERPCGMPLSPGLVPKMPQARGGGPSLASLGFQEDGLGQGLHTWVHSSITGACKGTNSQLSQAGPGTLDSHGAWEEGVLSVELPGDTLGSELWAAAFHREVTKGSKGAMCAAVRGSTGHQNFPPAGCWGNCPIEAPASFSFSSKEN